MKPDPNETYESWANRVELFEKGLAFQRLANGEPIEQVMSKMAHRITKKMLHPLVKSIIDANIVEND